MPSDSVAVVIPWRPSPGRDGHLDFVRAALIGALGHVPVVLADSGHEPFNRAASRNVGVREVDADVVVVCDADTIVEAVPLRAAVAAAGDGKMHLPYTVCRLLTRRSSEMILSRGDDPWVAAAESEWDNSVGGVIAADRQAWLDLGGMDERFTGWGFEDIAWWCVADTLTGWQRHSGTIWHLWHPDGRQIGSEPWGQGKALCDRYTDARGNPAAIRALIEERLMPAREVDIDASLAALAANEHCHDDMLKLPADLDRFATIIAATTPDVVIETGTLRGASARWFADHDVDVVTVDRHPVDVDHKRVTQIVGDSTDPQVVAEVAALTAGRRVMVTLDSDHSRDHVTAEVKAYSGLVSPDCHLVIEDTLFHHAPDHLRRRHGVGVGDDGTPMDAVHILQRSRRWRRDRGIETLSSVTASPAGWWVRV